MQHHTGFSRATALQMTTQCSACAPFHNTPIAGVNPRGLKLNDIWQMDVTHLPSAGKLKYMHVSVDTCSKVVFASLHSGEKIKDVTAHCLLAFAYMGLPNVIKTDNGPAYTSGKFQTFCVNNDIKHITGIPYNPTRQAIVQRMYMVIKQYFTKINRGEYIFSPNT